MSMSSTSTPLSPPCRYIRMGKLPKSRGVGGEDRSVVEYFPHPVGHDAQGLPGSRPADTTR